MLLPEAHLDTLLDQLKLLPSGDRKAVLTKLSPAERLQIRTRLRGLPPPRAASPWSQDIANCVENPAHLTGLGQAALARAVLAQAPAKPKPGQQAPVRSLIDMFVARFMQIAR